MNNDPIIPIKYTYPKSEHLKSRKAIEQLFKSGESVFVYPYKVVYQFIDDGQLITDNLIDNHEIKGPETEQLSENSNHQPSITSQPLLSGFAVSTKNFKHAVDRNRVKRLGKEAFRLNKHSLTQLLADNQLHLQVFFIYTEKKLPDWKLAEPRIQACLKKLIHLTKKHHEKLLQG